jgi:hypothetical protein
LHLASDLATLDPRDRGDTGNGHAGNGAGAAPPCGRKEGHARVACR